ncbi:hypothetical protein [Alkalibacterium gilvum]|uniref:hypothetical protein n=1 Tax=Alkalibacterium gilvum TaxID=1130080 RepID=UPI003F8FD3DA
MKKILILTILLGFFTFFSDQTVNAEENPTPSVLTETNSRTVRKVFTIQRNWSMREYNVEEEK